MISFEDIAGQDLAKRAQDIGDFSRAFVRPPLWDWQVELLREATSGRYRVAGISLPRQNGKTYMSSVVGAHRAITRPGSLVLAIANDREQARLSLEYAKQVMTGHRLLAAMLQGDPLQYELRLVNGSRWVIRSSESVSVRGLSPSLVIYDELGFAKDRRLYDVSLSAQIAQEDPLLLAISTVGIRGGPLWSIANSDSNSVLWIHQTRNLSPLIDAERLEAQRLMMPDVVYRREHLNQWIDSTGAYVTEDDLAEVRPGERAINRRSGSMLSSKT
jgi:hypothetical protein